MNRPLRKVAVAAVLMLIALIINVNVIQVGEAGSLRANPNNSRALYAEYDRARGPVVVGVLDVAKSIPTKDSLKYKRVYPQGSLYAAATGFYSLIYGATGLEFAEDSVLSGTDDRLLPERLSDYLTGRTPQGGSVVLTLNAQAQQAAAEGLKGHRGAVVALNPTTGAILALYSSPSFNPSQLSSHNGTGIKADYQKLVNEPSDPLLNRALNQSYPPGSLFKMVTASAALSSGRYTPESVIPAPTRLRYPDSDTYLTNFGGESCGNGRTDTLIDAFTISCNTAFANLGLKLGQRAISNQAQAFGVGTPLSIPLSVSASNVPETADGGDTERSAIGQGDDSLTPLQAAMIAAGIANNGTVMTPYLVSQVRSPDESVLDRGEAKVLSHAISPKVAKQMTTLMESVVNHGTGQAAQISGIQVAGKTGTAEHGTTAEHLAPDAWFASFAPATNPQVAVAVIVEDGGSLGSEATGGAVAAPIARSVMCAVLMSCH